MSTPTTRSNWPSTQSWRRATYRSAPTKWKCLDRTFAGIPVAMLPHSYPSPPGAGERGRGEGHALEHHHDHRAVSKPGDWQRGRGQNPRLDPGKQGQKTVVVERSMVGGSCPNVACLPSKNVIYSAKAVSLVHPTTGLGVVTGSVRVDMAGVAHRKREMVEGLVEEHLANFKASGAELVMGEARFTEQKTVRVALNAGGTRLLRGERIFINVGTRATIPDLPGLTAAGPMTHVEALELERLPGHLVVLGGGYVGLEFAQAMRRFGSRVTIVQHGPQLLKREDPDVADAVREVLADEGIEGLLRSQGLSCTGSSGKRVALRVRSGATETTLEASDILVAAGRTPNTDRLDAAQAGVELDSRGYIRVNDRLQTSAPDVWATGECAGSPQFTHVGEDDCR